VVPFTGSWSDFDHVLTHEINHAYVFDMMYRRSLQNIIMSSTPLWAMEGLAEYTSAGWDVASEAEFRDMVILGQTVSIEELSQRSDYLVYREGQAIYHFIVERYGSDRFHLFVSNLTDRGGLGEAVRKSFDMSLEQFDAHFQEWSRETYWPQVGLRDNPSDIGRPVQNRDDRICQAGTVISPDGMFIAGVEVYRAGYAVTVRSAVDGRLEDRCVVTGGLSDTGISPLYRVCAFSPGAESLAVALHGVSTDRLAVWHDGSLSCLPFEMDLIRDPVWTRDGAIAFCGMDGEATDVYVWDGALRRLTWTQGSETGLSPAGDSLTAVTECDGTWEVLMIDPVGGGTRVAARDTARITYPSATPAGITWLSNGDGTPDLVLQDSSGARRTIASLYQTMDSPCWADSGRILCFDSQSWDGCGVYIAYGLLDDSAGIAEAEPPARAAPATSARIGGQVPAPADTAAASRPLLISPYTPVLSTDYVTALAGYDSYAGLAGYTTFVFSDVLARHRVILDANFNGPVEDADAALLYSWLPGRTDWGAYIFRESTKYLFRFEDQHLEEVRDVDTGGGLMAVYPFTPALGADASADYRHITRKGTWNSDADYSADILSFGAGLVLDTAAWDWVGPRVGSRYSLRGEVAPGWDDMAEYATVSFDLRDYVWISGQVSLALRAAGASSWGDDAQRFFVGGAVPHRVLTGETEEFGDILGFYTNYGDMVRGHDYAVLGGSRYASSTVELRIPFVRTLWLDAPLPLTISGIRGVVFVDAATAFDDFRSFVGADTDGGYHLRDILMGLGFGFRANLGILILREDTAWSTDLGGIADKPVHYISLGAAF
jgi:hypothetical protein